MADIFLFCNLVVADFSPSCMFNNENCFPLSCFNIYVFFRRNLCFILLNSLPPTPILSQYDSFVIAFFNTSNLYVGVIGSIFQHSGAFLFNASWIIDIIFFPCWIWKCFHLRYYVVMSCSFVLFLQFPLYLRDLLGLCIGISCFCLSNRFSC